jgi:3-oxoacyl-[acyl-carrier-protein] synthase III
MMVREWGEMSRGTFVLFSDAALALIIQAVSQLWLITDLF